jgi:hypothetical protein
MLSGIQIHHTQVLVRMTDVSGSGFALPIGSAVICNTSCLGKWLNYCQDHCSHAMHNEINDPELTLCIETFDHHMSESMDDTNLATPMPLISIYMMTFLYWINAFMTTGYWNQHMGKYYHSIQL